MQPPTPPESPTDASVSSAGRKLRVIDVPAATSALGGELARVPYVIRILRENLLRSRALGRAVAPGEIGLLLASTSCWTRIGTRI